MSNFEKRDKVKVKATSKIGIVQRVLYNPYLPNWLSPPNYLVRINGEKSNRVFKKSELKLAE